MLYILIYIPFYFLENNEERQDRQLSWLKRQPKTIEVEQLHKIKLKFRNLMINIFFKKIK